MRTDTRRRAARAGALLVAGWVAGLLGAGAETALLDEGVSVEANYAEFDGLLGIIRYRGQVKLRVGPQRITFHGDTLDAQMERGRLTRLTGTGKPVVLRQYVEGAAIADSEGAVDPEQLRISALAERIVYDTARGVISMSGSVRLTQQGLGAVHADRVHYYINEQRIVAGAPASAEQPGRVLIKIPKAL